MSSSFWKGATALYYYIVIVSISVCSWLLSSITNSVQPEKIHSEWRRGREYSEERSVKLYGVLLLKILKYLKYSESGQAYLLCDTLFIDKDCMYSPSPVKQLQWRKLKKTHQILCYEIWNLAGSGNNHSKQVTIMLYDLFVGFIPSASFQIYKNLQSNY